MNAWYVRLCDGCVDAHGEVKYNAWEKPTEIAKWKEEHVRVVCPLGVAVLVCVCVEMCV